LNPHTADHREAANFNAQSIRLFHEPDRLQFVTFIRHFLVIAYRQHKFPVIYTELTFVREWSPSLLADCAEDLGWLNQLKEVASGKQCVSALEHPHVFLVTCEFPDDILERDGTTGDVLEWSSYGWKTYDVENLFISDMEPGEAIPRKRASEPLLTVGLF
jgi:hypothetical protein